MKAMRFVAAAGLAWVAGCNSQQVNWSPDSPWAAAPITVEWSEIDPVFESSFTSGIGAWNHAAGCDVFIKAPDPTTANISAGPYEGAICGDAGASDLDTVPGANAGAARCSPDRAEVKFKVLSDIRSAFVLWEHELGHVLGLAHDTSELMNPSPVLYDPAAFSGSAPVRLILPSDADGDAVGARYCR